MKRETRDLLIVGGVVLGGLGAYVYLNRDKTKTVTGTVTDVFTRGSVLTSSHMGDDGVIVEDPATLVGMASLAVAGVDADNYSLARMIRSEGADEGEVRGHVALNDLKGLGWSSLQYLLTYSTASWAIGRFGKQYSAKYQTEDGGETWNRSEAAKDDNGKVIVLDHQTRRYATTRDPYEGDLEMAMKVISDHQRGFDPTQGAVKFIDRSALAFQVGARDFDTINAQWMSEGLQPFTLDAYGTDLVLYKKA